MTKNNAALTAKLDTFVWKFFWPLRWRHNMGDSVSNHQPHHCLPNRLFRRRSKKTSKLRVTGLCVGNSPGPVNSPHKRPVTQKMFAFGDIIMTLDYFGSNIWTGSRYSKYEKRKNIEAIWVLGVGVVKCESVTVYTWHWPLGDVAIIIKVLSSNSCYSSNSREFPAKFISDACHRAILKISQHWFR